MHYIRNACFRGEGRGASGEENVANSYHIPGNTANHAHVISVFFE